MNAKAGDVRVSLVWEGSSHHESTPTFPEEVLTILKGEFRLAVCHKSPVFPLVLAEIPKSQFVKLEKYVADAYGPCLEVHEFN